MTDNLRRLCSDDELDRALTALHDDVPTDHSELAGARNALLTAAAGARPANTSLVTTAALPSAAPPATSPAVSRRWAGRRFAAAAAVLVLAAGGLVAQSALMDGDTPGSTAAAAALNAAASQMTPAADPPVRPGQYRYLRTHTWAPGIHLVFGGLSFAYLTERVHETWVPADQSETWLERRTITGKHRFVGADETEARALGILPDPPSVETLRARCGSFVATEPCTDAGGWQNPTPAWIDGLPRDPQRLYERLRADTPAYTPMLAYAADALRTGLLPSDVRSALYRALAKVPGLVIRDQAANLDGRIGIAYGMSWNTKQGRQEIIVDPHTGEFIGERTVMPADTLGVPGGTITSSTAVSTAVVDQIGTRPAR